MADLHISDQQLQDLAASAIVAALGPKEREALITNALRDLMTKAERGYGFDRTTPLHEAFKAAIRKKAEEIATKIVDEDPALVKKIEDMVREAVASVVTKNRDETVKALQSAVWDAFFRLTEDR